MSPPDEVETVKNDVLTTSGSKEDSDSETDKGNPMNDAQSTQVTPYPAPRIARSEALFTWDELNRIAASQGIPLEGFKCRWIVQKGNSFYVIGMDGQYTPPRQKGELLVSLPRDLSRVQPARADDFLDPPAGQFSWEKMKGEQKVNRSVDELLAMHCVVATTIAASMAITHSFYERETQTFYERVCTMRPITPRFDLQIDTWLRLLGGTAADKLLDWIATITDLSRPTCALYVYGSKGSGKTMLAEGLARLWSDTPTMLDSLVGPFNSRLAECPLVFADEELPKEMTSGSLRSLVARSSHPLRRKNIPEAGITGCIRLIISANDADLLKFDTEDFSSDSIDAIAERFLSIATNSWVGDTEVSRAAEYLKSIGGRTATDDWVTGDRIAGHALWLKETRKVDVGSRWLVRGVIAGIHRQLATHGSIRGQVLEWIARAMAKSDWGTVMVGKESVAIEPGIQFGGGHIYVNAKFVREQWVSVLRDQRVPSSDKIGKALRPLTRQKTKKIELTNGRVEFHAIEPDYLFHAVEEMQLGDVTAYRAAVYAPREYGPGHGLDNPPLVAELVDELDAKRRASAQRLELANPLTVGLFALVPLTT